MVNETATKPEVIAAKPAGRHFGDRAFKWLTLLMALAIFVLIALIGYELARGSQPALHKFGWHFLVSSDWDPGNDNYGALPFILGTLVSSLIALVIAVPISIATAVYLTELAPLWLRQPLIMFIELLAAIPSVILGFLGIVCHGSRGCTIICFRRCGQRSVFCRFFEARITVPACWPPASSSPS